MSAFDRPVLAFGMPRSGTTWLGKILDSHPATLYRHEPDTWQLITAVPLFAAPGASAADRAALRGFVAALPAIRADRVCGKRPFFPKDYASLGSVRWFELRSILHKLLVRAGVKIEPPAPPQPSEGTSYRLVWKSIESLGRVGVVLESLPEARFIQIVRHPCGYVASVLRGESENRFGHNQAAWDFDLFRMACETAQARRHGIDEAALRAMRPDERLAWRWVVYNEKAADEARARPNALVLYYEQLCAHPLEMTRRLLDFCELSWNPQTERFIHESTSSTKSDYYSVFKNPLDSAWRWKSQLPPDSAERVMRIVASSAAASPYLEANDWNRVA